VEDFFFNCWCLEITVLGAYQGASTTCARLSTGSVLGFLCWKWKPYSSNSGSDIWVLLFQRQAACWKSVSIRIGLPTRSVAFEPTANAELVPKFQISMRASHITLNIEMPTQ
jgi:hypothetical protein